MSSEEEGPSLAAFADRRDAGRQLAAQLLQPAPDDPIVVGLPRGGVPVAAEVAAALDAPLEVLTVRKLGAPHNPEYGIGAIAEDGTRVLDRVALEALGVDHATLDSIVDRETRELSRRVAAYRGGRRSLALSGRTVIVVDDGVATGITDTAALRAARRQRPSRLILAVPVGAPESVEHLRGEADEVVCLIEPQLLYGVGQWYTDFTQVTDAEVVGALRRAEADDPA
ncbi:MAG TPA: phosphoribosyltransferase family protein [Solirubrobacterales bacterium]|nr:phosphoribosyltransferase family protein [Solirubrobacterales bacterium]